MNQASAIDPRWQDFLAGEGLHMDENGHPARTADEAAPVTGMAPLHRLAVLSVTGEDAESFLEGQFSAAVAALEEDRLVLTAWHDPKGRVRTLILLGREKNGFHCLMPRELVADILPKLKMYVLRSQVTFRDHGEERVVLGWHGEGPPAGFHRLHGAGDFAFWQGPVEEAIQHGQAREGAAWLDDNDWRQACIRARIPWIGRATSGLFLPQFLELERFDGLSYRKGCYIGQEVIARTHYLGKVKQGLFTAMAPVAAMAGSEVRDDNGRRVGHVLDAARTDQNRWLLQLVIRTGLEMGSLHVDEGDGIPLEPVSPS